MIPMFVKLTLGPSAKRLSEVGAAFNRLAQFFVTDVRVLKGLTWRRIAYTTLVAAGLPLIAAVAIWMRARYGSKPQPIGIAQMLLQEEWGWLAGFRLVMPVLFSQMLALTVADNLQIFRIPRSVLLVVAFVLGTAVGSAVVMTSGSYADSPLAWGLAWGGLLALVYFKRRRDEELAAALHAAKLAQVDLKTKALEAELQLMQARVEPQFLFNTMRRVGELYETDPSTANRTLESLIVYLRATLPQMRTTASTLGREVEVTRAYIDIERAGRDDRFDFTFDFPQPLASTRFPPMVMLPLIQALVLRGHDGSDYDGALRGEARTIDGRLELVLTHTGGHGQPSIEVCGDIGSRLAALYGSDGKLDIAALRPRGAIARLSVPYAAG